MVSGFIARLKNCNFKEAKLLIMKKLLLLVAFFLVSGNFIKASAENLNLDVSLTYATFTTTEQPYVEIYLHVLGASVQKIVVNDSLFQSKVEVVTVFKQNGDIVKFDKYLLESPVSKNIVNFYDIKRYGLENGKYDLEVSVRDINNAASARVFKSRQ